MHLNFKTTRAEEQNLEWVEFEAWECVQVLCPQRGKEKKKPYLASIDYQNLNYNPKEQQYNTMPYCISM